MFCFRYILNGQGEALMLTVKIGKALGIRELVVDVVVYFYSIYNS